MADSEVAGCSRSQQASEAPRPRPRWHGWAPATALAALLLGSAAAAAAPPERDYGAEVIAMIAEGQGAAADGSDNKWWAFSHATNSLGSAVRFFVHSSTPLQEYAGAGEDRSVWDVVKRLQDPTDTPDPDGVLTSEGERLMEALDRAGWWEALRAVREGRAFVPPQQHGAILGWHGLTSANARHAWQMCGVRWRRALDEGDFETAAVAMEDVFAVGRVLSWTPPMPLVGLRSITLRSLLARADQWRDQPEFARSVLAALDRQPLAPSRMTLEYSRLMGLEAIETELAQFVADEIERRRAQGDDVNEETFWAIAGLMMEPPDEQMARLNAIVDAQVALLESRGEAIAPARQRVDDLAEDLDRHVIVGLMVPSAGLYRHHREWATRGAARIALALEIHRAETGAYPESLEELEALDELPPDPWSDQPLRYVRQPDGGVIVYTVGQDLVDNGGREYADRPGAPHERAPRRMWDGFDAVLYRAPGG